MTITPDYLLERKRTKQQLRRWKLFALSVPTILALCFLGNKPITLLMNTSEDYIASITIESTIYDDDEREKNLRALIDSKQAKALIVHINSPGGGACASEKLYKILEEIKEKKPVVTVLGSIATSGGYMIALASDYIIAQNSTITGSIGVVSYNFEIVSLAEKMGININKFKSSPLKAMPNPFERTTSEVEEAMQSGIDDIYNYFIELVIKNRKIEKNVVKSIADGRVYTGRQALNLRLIDYIGTTQDALIWLQETKKISKDLKIKNVNLKTESKLHHLLMPKNIVFSIFSYFHNLLLSYNMTLFM